MTFPARRTGATTGGSQALQKRGAWVVVGAVAVIGVLLPIAWSVGYRPDAGSRAGEQHIGQALNDFGAQGGDRFKAKMADDGATGEPLPALPEDERSKIRVPAQAPPVPASGWQGSGIVHESMPPLDEGSSLAVQKRLHAVPVFSIGNREGRTRATDQPAAGAQSSSVRPSGENGSMLPDPSSAATDPAKSKADATQASAQGTGTGQNAGGADSTGSGRTATEAHNDSGGQGGTGSGGQTGDGSAPTADNAQQAGNADPEVIKIKASDMQWDPSHAKLRKADGEIMMYANSTVDAQFTLNSQAQGLSIFARADKANGEWPTVTVSIDGTPIGTVVVNSANEKKFFLPISVAPGEVSLQMNYTNDFYDPNHNKDRNVYISRVKVVAQGAQNQ